MGAALIVDYPELAPVLQRLSLDINISTKYVYVNLHVYVNIHAYVHLYVTGQPGGDSGLVKLVKLVKLVINVFFNN